MEIVIAAQGIPFGPDTLDHYSLGGSETAVICAAKELRKLGHIVTVFCNLSNPDRKDHVPSGHICETGVRWVSIEQYQVFITNTETDLLIVSRNPDLFQVMHQARKAVLWCHDLATYSVFLGKFIEVSFNFDEVWALSEFHKEQIHNITGYPKEFIKITRNGICKFDSVLPVPREDKTLLYSARPERGLINLVREGGIMEHLPDYTLKVTMYDNYPEHMMDLYRFLWNRCNDLPNVELLGSKTQLELRQLMASCWAYVYPTVFEEISCIIARECIEQKLPVITTRIGALPETLKSCGHFVDGTKENIGSDKWNKDFAECIEFLHDDSKIIEFIQSNCAKRTDLYWDKVVKQWVKMAKPKDVSHYSKVHSMIQDADVIPAWEYMKTIPNEERTMGIEKLEESLRINYQFVFGSKPLTQHYEDIYILEDKKDVPERRKMITLKDNQRYRAIAHEVEKFSDGSNILEYGCAEGPIILQLAQDFPDKNFIGIDFVPDNISLCVGFAKEADITNVEFYCASTEDWPEIDKPIHVAIIAEVLEHVVEPWKVLQDLESHVEVGGRIVSTVPQGPWEWNGLVSDRKQWPWRAHIWHINKWAIRTMIEGKQGSSLASLTEHMDKTGRYVGHLVFSYDADHSDIHPFDPLEKAKQHRPRQTIAACMIAMDNESEILRCLDSIHPYVEIIQIALGPCTDHTLQYIQTWSKEHPWIDFRIIDAPRIENRKFGFDDARNLSIKDIETDWILWIDTDEYLSGEQIKMYARNNAFDSYAVHQHHFTCEPRGTPAQIDKPARMIRNNHGFKFFGKIHEHAEVGFNGGPGFVYIIPNIDIGHTGYVNDLVRRHRFVRNFPMLEWDREVYPERNLGKFLWLRDLIHRMKAAQEVGDKNLARKLALETIDYYEEVSESFAGVGGGYGIIQGLSYCSEALQLLGRGVPAEISVKLDNQVATYSGLFENIDDMFKIAKKSMEEELKRRLSGYWA
jgi:glycosyltransferase involved in cell wall biosynthesis/2-polyprenyl-3-methyl-5-hydroxy-6-metoxy-1,4-benzoquinol methylase